MDLSHLAPTAIHTTFCGSYLALLGLGSFWEAESSRYAGGQDSEEKLMSPYQGNCCVKSLKTSSGHFLLLFQSTTQKFGNRLL